MKTRPLRLLAIASMLTFALLLGACHSLSAFQPPRQGERTADLRRYDDDWFAAARLGRVDILQALLDAGYPIDAATPQGYTALILASYDGQPLALDYLAARGANPCLGDRNGNTALMGAIFKGELPIAKQLLNAACPIDQANNAGETALSFAALFGRLSLLPELVKRGADPDHADARGNTALQTARTQGNDEAFNALIRAGATR
ncbi:ankyrin repeat domain-containing protein [Trinickia terrae]|uniref:Ankyrin repeat domain-containing protein n=1 Tax=Trinickia terrae TaxID=2571161 RepID=A0A4U1HRN0_9BURK|nr:ankyrin repeat domain-containing protein [Trinickia terrae]TKC81446.1 ankyrin repeat domain-containing protein [Trinickia terrae]